jgi:hypothetical protein
MVTPGLCSKNFSPVIGPISISSGSLWMSLETLSVAGATVITTTDSGLAQVWLCPKSPFAAALPQFSIPAVYIFQ